jgi:hypothetical protein
MASTEACQTLAWSAGAWSLPDFRIWATVSNARQSATSQASTSDACGGGNWAGSASFCTDSQQARHLGAAVRVCVRGAERSSGQSCFLWSFVTLYYSLIINVNLLALFRVKLHLSHFYQSLCANVLAVNCLRLVRCGVSALSVVGSARCGKAVAK